MLYTLIYKDPFCKGIVMAAPMLQLKVLNGLMMFILKSLAWWCPKLRMPWFLDRNVPEKGSSNPKILEIIMNDPFKPKGNRHTHFGTALQYLKALSYLNSNINSFDQSVLILHAPEDEVTLFAGSVDFLSRCRSEDKKLIEYPGKLHNLVWNDFETVCKETMEWIVKR